MTLQIRRDENGIVTITDLRTGKSEVRATGVVAHPVRADVGDAEALPSHQWSRLA